MNRIILLAMLILPTAAFADGFELVTVAEYQQSETALEAAVEDPFDVYLKSVDPLGPAILIESPELDADIRPPVDIRVEFVPKDEATIDWESLRVLYGAFRIDVTDRVLEHAQFTDKTMICEGAELPSGRHTLTLEIADDLGRAAKERIRFRVRK